MTDLLNFAHTTLRTGKVQSGHPVYETLEARCIPVVERRCGSYYFRRAYGPHPMLEAWKEAANLIKRSWTVMRRRSCDSAAGAGGARSGSAL